MMMMMMMADRMAGETVWTSGRLSDENLAVDHCCHLVVSTNADVARSDVQVDVFHRGSQVVDSSNSG